MGFLKPDVPKAVEPPKIEPPQAMPDPEDPVKKIDARRKAAQRIKNSGRSKARIAKKTKLG